MRIIGGHRKGLRLAPVGKGDQDAHLRPTTDRIRESLFNILQSGRHGDRLSGARVLDIFAGTGALGLEAYSRGASYVQFIENGRMSLRILKQNVALFNSTPFLHVQQSDAARLNTCPEDPFTLVFLDPPYGSKLGETTLKNAAEKGWIAKGAIIAAENDHEAQNIDGFDKFDVRRFGKSVFSFLIFK